MRQIDFRYRWSLLILASLAVLLTSCSSKSYSEERLIADNLFVFKIHGVVDKNTGELITKNHLVIRIKIEGEELREYFTDDIQMYYIEIPVGAEAEILMEAEGYKDWEITLRPKKPKFMFGPARMDPIDINFPLG